MGVSIPGVTGLLHQPTGQVIDGSLKFDRDSKTYITRTPASAGDQNTWTWSTWVKRSSYFGSRQAIFGNVTVSATTGFACEFDTNNRLDVFNINSSGTYNGRRTSTRRFRDIGWYHIVIVVDTSLSIGDKIKVYVNGDQITDFDTKTNLQAAVTPDFNTTNPLSIGRSGSYNAIYSDNQQSQVYFIDGQALGPEYFGFTDGLTNTWRPKKYTGTFGTNGFYLPMDGNSPIGQDKSGNGNDFTPVNFGGSVALDNPQVSGARPILNTLPGGTQAVPGVFGSKENKYYTVTTANGSVYQFDITSGDNPSLSFIRGATYKFDYSSFTGHPVLFSSTNPDSSTTAYTDGTSIASNVISFTVPHDAPDTLYYYCQNHPTSMNGSISVTTDETKADPYAWKNFLALPLVGSDNDVSDSVNCTSNAKTPTNSSVTASTTQSNFYGGSHHWNATTDTLQYAEQGNELVFGTGDFTIECWFYDDNSHNGGGSGRCYIFDNRIGGSVVGDPPTMVAYVDTHNTITFYDGDSNITETVGSTVGKWWHFAVTREGTTTRMFIDGVLRGSSTSSTNFTNNGIGVGRATDGGYGWAGYIQDFRVYKGVAKYTSDFVVPSTSPDILPDTPSGVSGGSKLTKITDGAVSFDGSGDYLSVTGPGALAASSNWCMECFFYCTGDASGTYRIMSANESAQSSEYLQMRIRLGQYQFYTDNANTLTGTAVFNKWTHMALTKSGTTVRAFVDGVKIWEVTDNNADSVTTLITGWGYGGEYFPGIISNARFVNGSSVYTADFTPPTAPLTNITNTYLLCCQSNVTSGAAAVSPNISGINDGTVWSSTVTGPTRKEDRVANAFNGSTSGPGAIPAYPGTLTFAPGFTGLTTVKIYGYYAGSGVTLHVNGSQQSPSSGAYTLTISTSTLDSIVWTAIDGFNYIRIDAIEIDGTVLVDPVVGPDDSNESATNFNPFTTDINTVRGQETGYATMNPLDKHPTSATEDGNLVVSNTSNLWCGIRGTFGRTSGKFYYEVKTGGAGSGGESVFIGLGSDNPLLVTTNTPQADNTTMAAGTVLYCDDGQKILDSSTRSSYGTAISNQDLIGVAYDLDNKTIEFFNNGISQGVIDFSSTVCGETNQIVFPYYISYYNSTKSQFNFGQKPFKFPPPEGYQSLNLASTRPETVIARPDQYVGIVTYTSNNSTLSVTDFKFRPDLLIFKNRDTANHWGWFDSVRGPNKWLRSSGTNNEVNTSGGGYGTGTMNSFDPFGFTLGDDVGANVTNYPSDDGHVVYGFRAGGNPGISSTTYWIDDKEYSASGAKMSVGSLNSLAYNQSAEWSDSVAGTPYPGQTVSRLFDGSVLTGLIPNNGTSLVFTTTAFPSITKLRIYGYSYTGNAGGIQVNGNDYTSLFNTGGGYSSSSKWVTIPVSSLEKIEWSIESNGLENGHLGAIEVDGKILVDTSVSINAPTIQPTGCSVGTKQGFSIVQFAGTSGAATIPHGLTQAPQFAIIRSNYSGANWPCYHTGLSGPTKYVWLNSQNGEATQAASWNSQDPTQFLFHIAGEAEVNRNGYHSIAYMWHDVPGLQKFGSYIGNQNADGTYVELGFRPKLVWIKAVSVGGSGYSWYIHDSERSKFNPTTLDLKANSNATDVTTTRFDFLSNGFKIRGANLDMNDSGETFIYCAWAEAPTFNLYGGQANAR